MLFHNGRMRSTGCCKIEPRWRVLPSGGPPGKRRNRPLSEDPLAFSGPLVAMYEVANFGASRPYAFCDSLTITVPRHQPAWCSRWDVWHPAGSSESSRQRAPIDSHFTSLG